MSKELLSRTSENTIRITAEFFEDGYVLKSGRSKIHRYDLDLYVRSDITLDQLLGAVFCGLRDVLQKKYGLDLKENLAGIVYQDLQDPFAFRAADSLRGSRHLRQEHSGGIRMRTEAMRYRHQRRQLANLNDAYRMLPDEHWDLPVQERERLAWIVCWQVFHECYLAYVSGGDNGQFGAAPVQVRDQSYRLHPVIAKSSVDVALDDESVSQGAARHPLLQLNRARDGRKTLQELGFFHATRLIFDPVLWHHSAALYDAGSPDPTLCQRLPYYDCGRREEHEVDQTEVSIQPLMPPPQKPELRNTLLLLLVPLVMLLLSLLAINVAGIETAHSMQAFAVMMAATLMTGLVCLGLYWIGHLLETKNWIRSYERRIRKTLLELKTRQARDCAMMHQDHPPVFDPKGHTDLIHQILSFEGALFGSEPGDWDFLGVRLGVSAEGSCLVPSVFPVTGINQEGPIREIRYRNLKDSAPEAFELTWRTGKKHGKKDGDDSGMISDLPGDIARQYGFLDGAPVLLDLKNAGAVGLVLQDQQREFDPLLQNMILDLCFHHGPEQLQLVALFPPQQDWKACNDRIRLYKHLPHFDSLLQDRSAFAFSKSEALDIFNRIYAQLRSDREIQTKTPHTVVFVMEEYGLRTHPLASYLPENRGEAQLDRGITFVFCKHDERELPAWCANTLVVDPRDQWFLLPCRRSDRERRDYTDRGWWSKYRFSPDTLIQANQIPDHKPTEKLLSRAFRTISGTRRRTGDQNRLPPFMDLFSTLLYPDQLEACMSGDRKVRQEYLTELRQSIRTALDENWSIELSDSLQIPVGCTETDLVTLDLHEKADGPNLLIAGDRETGKTTAAITLLYTMALLYAPDMVSMIPVDLCDRGLAKELEYLPHTLQQWSLRGGSREEVLEYLQRLIDWLESEILRRVQRRCYGLPVQRESDGETDPPMERLFIILDDYQMLARMVSEHMDLSERLVGLMKSAEGTGIHFVLISDGSAEAVSDSLLAQLRARICLRLADADMAKRISHSDHPARMGSDVKGRAYRPGTVNSTAEFFQIGFGGADVAGLAYPPFQVVLAPAGGKNRCFFDSESYTPDNPLEVLAWMNAVFAPLRVHYGKKQKKAERPAPFRETDPLRDDPQEDRFGENGDRRWDGTDSQNRNLESGDQRWNEPRSHGPTSADGDARWNDTRPEVRRTHEGDSRWEQSSRGSGETASNHAAAGTQPDYESHRNPDPAEEKQEPGTRNEPVGRDERWRERYFRRWNGYPYNDVAPDYGEPNWMDESKWVNPDEALRREIPFGITQQRFIAAVMADKLQSQNADSE